MAERRLTPTSCSRKLLALEFIRAYRARFSTSPSIGEIAADQGISASAAKKLVRRLEADGKIIRARGVQRGIVLPGEVDQAKALLVRTGWTALDGERGLLAPGPNRDLPIPEALFHMAEHDDRA